MTVPTARPHIPCETAKSRRRASLSRRSASPRGSARISASAAMHESRFRSTTAPPQMSRGRLANRRRCANAPEYAPNSSSSFAGAAAVMLLEKVQKSAATGSAGSVPKLSVSGHRTLDPPLAQERRVCEPSERAPPSALCLRLWRIGARRAAVRARQAPQSAPGCPLEVDWVRTSRARSCVAGAPYQRPFIVKGFNSRAADGSCVILSPRSVSRLCFAVGELSHLVERGIWRAPKARRSQGIRLVRSWHPGRRAGCRRRAAGCRRAGTGRRQPRGARRRWPPRPMASPRQLASPCTRGLVASGTLLVLR